MDTIRRSAAGLRRSSIAPHEMDSEDSGRLSHFVNETNFESARDLDPPQHHTASFINPFQSSPQRSRSTAAKTGSHADKSPFNRLHATLLERRTSGRGASLQKDIEKVEIPKRVSSKPVMGSSKRSSLSFGGDLTFDLKIEDPLGM
jgi:hypothetical protein